MIDRENPLTALSIIQQLVATTSRVDKEQIIFRAFMDGEVEFFLGVRLALDPLVTFGLTKVAEIIEDDGEPGDFCFADFMTLAHDLWRRKLSDPRAAINDAAQRCHVATWNLFYRRILLKEMSIGLQAKSINKVLNKLVTAYPEAKDYLIPIFGCQLPHADSVPSRLKLHGRKRIDTKLEGVRAISILDTEAQTVNFFTQSGKILQVPEFEQALANLLAQLPGSLVLDGKLVSPHGAAHVRDMLRRRAPDVAHLKYAIFDILPLADFRVGFCATPQDQRHALLAAMQEGGLWRMTNGRVYVVPQIEVDLDTYDGQTTLAEFGQQAVSVGYSAIMLKDPDAPYTAKRSTAWLQLRLQATRREYAG